jgi:hypothetical protein
MPSIGQYLQPVLNTGIQMKDFAHASRLYADSVFALAPKTGFLYYVEFDIDPSTLTDSQWSNQQRVTEVGLLVKSIDLPKFTVQTETVNQYNRKTVIQKGITYNPLNLTFHDDNSNVVHNMWLNYYRYYYADSTWGGTGPIGTARDNVPGAYQNNKYLPSNDLFNPTNYGMNSKLVIAPFFRSITIYQLSRKIFTSYKLVNPIIQTWEHDKLDQSQGSKVAESKMTINYEAVFYGTGQVRKDSPTGFAVFHYDNSPSPLSLAGGGNSSVFGPGGVVAGALDIYGDVSNILNPDSKAGPLGILGTVLKGANLVRNVKGVTKESLRAEGYKILDNTLRGIAQGSLNGLGVNLNLNKGNNYATSGQFLGTPVAVVTAAAIGQEFGPGGTTSRESSPTGSTPTNALGSSRSTTAGKNNQEDLDRIDKAKNTQSSDDNDADGSTISPGTYFPQASLLLDDQPYTAPFVDELSAEEDIQIELDSLNSSWMTDLDYLEGQSVPFEEIQAKLNETSTPAEEAAVKADAKAALASEKALLEQINNKYSAERERLDRLLAAAKSRTSGSGTVSTTPDVSSDSPGVESTSLPDIEF